MTFAIKTPGDSLTYGTGSTVPGGSTSYPSRLSTLLGGQTVTNMGVPGETSAQILTRVLADTVGVDDIYVFWAGHNDDDAARANTVSNIAAMVAHLGSNTKFLVLSMISRTYEDANTGGGPASRAVVTSINSALQSAYGAKYLDILSTLIAAYNPNDATDAGQHAVNNIPYSLRANAPTDSIHVNDGAYAIIAKQVARAVWVQGWATTPYVLRDVIAQPSRSTSEVLVAYDETGEALPRNVLLRDAAALRTSYTSAGLYRGQRAVLDVQADTTARAVLS